MVCTVEVTRSPSDTLNVTSPPVVIAPRCAGRTRIESHRRALGHESQRLGGRIRAHRDVDSRGNRTELDHPGIPARTRSDGCGDEILTSDRDGRNIGRKRSLAFGSERRDVITARDTAVERQVRDLGTRTDTGEKGDIILRRTVERQRDLAAVAVERTREGLRLGADRRPVIVENNIRSEAESLVEPVADLFEFRGGGDLIGSVGRTFTGCESADADLAHLRRTGAERGGQLHLAAEEIGGRSERDGTFAGRRVRNHVDTQPVGRRARFDDRGHRRADGESDGFGSGQTRERRAVDLEFDRPRRVHILQHGDFDARKIGLGPVFDVELQERGFEQQGRTLDGHRRFTRSRHERHLLRVDAQAVGFGGTDARCASPGVLVGNLYAAEVVRFDALHVAAFREAVGRVDNQFIEVVGRSVVVRTSRSQRGGTKDIKQFFHNVNRFCGLILRPDPLDRIVVRRRFPGAQQQLAQRQFAVDR